MTFVMEVEAVDMEPHGANSDRERVRVLLADDHATVRAVIAQVLDSHERLAVNGEAADGIEVIERLTEREADVVLMDVRMPRLNGVQATRVVRCLWPEIHIVGLSIHGADDFAARAMCDAGADWVLSKTADTDEILAGILRVADRAGSAA